MAGGSEVYGRCDFIASIAKPTSDELIDREHLWLPDSRFLIEFYEDYTQQKPDTFRIYDTKTKRYVRSLVLYKQVRPQFKDIVAVSSNRLIEVQDGVTSMPDSPAHIVEYKMDGRVSLGRETSIQFPAGCQIVQHCLSPPGNRIAWLVQSTQASPLDIFLHRLMPGYIVSSKQETALWLTRADGSDMRQVGFFISPSGKAGGSLRDVRWLPNGKRLSFIYKDEIYTVPVE